MTMRANRKPVHDPWRQDGSIYDIAQRLFQSDRAKEIRTPDPVTPPDARPMQDGRVAVPQLRGFLDRGR